MYKEVSSSVECSQDGGPIPTANVRTYTLADTPLIADGQLEKIKLGFNCLLKMLIVIVKYLIASVEIWLICLQSSDLTCQECSASLNSLPIVPKLFLDLSLLGGVGRLSVPLPVPESPLPGGSTRPVQHGRPVLASLLVQELLLVSGLPVVAGGALLHAVDVVALLHVAAALRVDQYQSQSIFIKH